MDTDDVYFRCPHCNKQYTREEFSTLEGHCGLFAPDDNYVGAVKCAQCNKVSGYTKRGVDGVPITDHKEPSVGNECWHEDEPRFVPSEADLQATDDIPSEADPIACVHDLDGPSGLSDEQQPVNPYGGVATQYATQAAPDPGDIRQQRIALFQERIRSIDKNLTHIDRAPLMRQALDIILDEPSSDIQACFQMMKDEFKLTSREIEAFRVDFNKRKKQVEDEKQARQYSKLINTWATPKKELSYEEEQEALAYLKDPNLLKNISRDISYAGALIGEETNKMMLYLSAISRKFKTPISIVIFGQSSTGKSYLANTIAKFVPPEDRVVISSATATAFYHAPEECIKHKFMLIQEIEGADKVMQTIRTLQSEGKLSRWQTVKDPKTDSYITVRTEKDCPCTVVMTTTQERIHNENSTRIFELYTDESIKQTERVVKAHIAAAGPEQRSKNAEKRRIINLHHNAQRLLEPVDVVIPFNKLLTFPFKTARNRRDVERFLGLIRTVAFLHQKQKQINTQDGERYVEADMKDYEIAYNLAVPVIKATLHSISERAVNVLKVCCRLNDELNDERGLRGEIPWFTISQIQAKAPELGLDFGNRPDLYKQLNKLQEHEYLELCQERPGATKKYAVRFAYQRDQRGEIINIGPPEIKEITTPTELRQKMATA